MGDRNLCKPLIACPLGNQLFVFSVSITMHEHNGNSTIASVVTLRQLSAHLRLVQRCHHSPVRQNALIDLHYLLIKYLGQMNFTRKNIWTRLMANLKGVLAPSTNKENC